MDSVDVTTDADSVHEDAERREGIWTNVLNAPLESLASGEKKAGIVSQRVRAQVGLNIPILHSQGSSATSCAFGILHRISALRSEHI